MKKILFALLFMLTTMAFSQFTNDIAGWYRGAFYIPDGTVYSEGVTVVDEGTLVAESLNETDFATHAKWDITNDLLDTGGNAAYVWSANQTSTLTQIQANLATTGVDAVWYLFTYTVAVTTAFDGDGVATITTGFASSAVALDLSAGTHSVYFKSKTIPVDFVISVVSGTDTEGSWTIDDVTLRQITGGNVDISGILLVRGVDIGASVGAGSDDQKIDVFSISGDNVQLSLENDGEATKTVDVSTTTAVTANTAKVGVTTELKNIVEDITPQAGANFDIQAFNITGTGLWQAGTVAFGKGGTGLSSWTQYLIPYAATTTSIGQIAIGSSGDILTSGGAGVAPSFQAPSAGGDFSDGGEAGGAARTLGNTDGYNMGFETNDVERAYFHATAGHLYPFIPNTYNLGGSANVWNYVYSNYFTVSNRIERANDPDTYIDFSASDNFKMYIGGVKFFEFSNTSSDFYSFGEGLDIDWYTAWMSFNYGTGLVTITKTTTFDEDVTAVKFLKHSVTVGITATNPGVQGDSPLTKEVNEVSTVGTASDAVTLISAVAGYEITVINNGAETLEIWPASGDNLGAGVDTATTLAAGSNITFVAYDATNWETI